MFPLCPDAADLRRPLDALNGRSCDYTPQHGVDLSRRVPPQQGALTTLQKRALHHGRAWFRLDQIEIDSTGERIYPERLTKRALDRSWSGCYTLDNRSRGSKMDVVRSTGCYMLLGDACSCYGHVRRSGLVWTLGCSHLLAVATTTVNAYHTDFVVLMTVLNHAEVLQSER